MTTLSTLVPSDDLRVQILRERDLPATRGCVLLWVQRCQRSSNNPAADLAVRVADELGLPVIACFCLAPTYPSATLRSFHFMAEGLQELPGGFASRGIGWALRCGSPESVIPAIATEFSAAVVVTDLSPTRPERGWKTAIADTINRPMVAVDTDVIVPSAHFPKDEWAPRTIRPKLWKLVDRYLVLSTDPVALHRSTVREGDDPLELIEGLEIDRTVQPSPRFRGGQTAARYRLDHFVKTLLQRYEVDRNRSDIDGSSGIGPYLHFGQISPAEIAIRTMAAEMVDVAPASIQSFMNELMVQRELAINFALRNPNFDNFNAIPDWGKRSLEKHASDPRPYDYSIEELEFGQTHDRLWNAAQRQLVAEGFMPNRLRMYWAKQLLYWMPSAGEAYGALVHLNDRYFVCGRDSNGYAQIAWAIGGRHDRPFPPDKPVTGLIRPMGLRAMTKHFDVNAYVDSIDRQFPV